MLNKLYLKRAIDYTAASGKGEVYKIESIIQENIMQIRSNLIFLKQNHQNNVQKLFSVLSEAQEDTASDTKYYSDGKEKRCPRVFFYCEGQIFFKCIVGKIELMA